MPLAKNSIDFSMDPVEPCLIRNCMDEGVPTAPLLGWYFISNHQFLKAFRSCPHQAFRLFFDGI